MWEAVRTGWLSGKEKGAMGKTVHVSCMQNHVWSASRERKIRGEEGEREVTWMEMESVFHPVEKKKVHHGLKSIKGHIG